MKLHFDPNLDFQRQAIDAVVRLFEGAPAARVAHRGFELLHHSGAVPNTLDLSDVQLLANLQAVQQDPELHNGSPLPVSPELGSRDFSIEMETGTGKTYVYLRTAFELNRAYGFRKFIVVVPSVAIREGVLKTLRITRDHFARLYDHVPYRFYEYDSGNLARVRQFAASTDVEIMVMTLDAFNKDSNIFNRRMDRMMGLKPLDLVQAVRPILILDEPQNMESEISRRALASLDPLFKLRYSASHRELYNLVYRLTPVDAYNLRLVKQIEVASVVEDHDANRAYLRCLSVDTRKTTVSARLQLYVGQTAQREASDPVLRTRTVRAGDDLHAITGLDAYAGYVVEALDAGYGEVRFSNGTLLTVGQEIGPDHELIARVQIANTIEEHMRKAERLHRRDIKVLSLFFIDEVANYTEAEGYIRRAFVEEFERLKRTGAPWAARWRDVDPGAVQGSYFSAYKTESYMEADADAYDLIMRDKERLLSLDEPVAFIFSHSALREGWDNPNIFQICTLNRTLSTIRKRQEIGRGMRLAVDQAGQRVFDDQVNRLTVVANESYREYCARLQEEYRDEFGSAQPQLQPKNARKRRTVHLKKGFELDPHFRELWAHVARRTRYRVQLDTEALIAACAAAVAPIRIAPVQVRTARVRIDQIRDRGQLDYALLGQSAVEVPREYEIPNVTAVLADATHLTRRTLRTILARAGNLDQVYHNPADFLQQAADAINAAKRRFLVDGVQYIEIPRPSDAEPTAADVPPMDGASGDAPPAGGQPPARGIPPVDGALYEMSLFDDLEAYEDSLVPIEKSIYDAAVVDSQVERDFALALERMDEVKRFVKLPDWFTVDTPIGTYNPDWAILLVRQDAFGEEVERLYLVRETKGSMDEAQRRGVENMKIACAKRHFGTLGVDYRDVTKASELFTP